MNIIYECKFCKKHSKDQKEILTCEAAHLGLTLEEKQEWDELKKKAEYAGCVINRTKNEETDKAFDNAIMRLVNFEKAHGLLNVTN